MTRKTIRETFDEHWKLNPETGCHEWQRSKNKGYGQLSRGGGATRPIEAHRFSWIRSKGPIPDGLYVLHRCDNRACVNPEHLFLGTHADNNADRIAKGRSKGCPRPGEANPAAKLTVELVQRIRAEYAAGGVWQKELAAKYGIKQSTVSCITRRATWQ